MGTERFYKPGSFYRICDRTGFATRAERTSTEWNNLIVRDDVYERRHPQDFVKGVQDNQTVPYARPRQPNVFLSNTTNGQFAVGTTAFSSRSINVTSGQFQVYQPSAVDPSKFPSGF